ncbi:MAG: hypothetical protein DMD38_02720 [Gemmatimonadetes bacterium]|nr:MAG: hypothetical protein AUI86_06630 [Gemmatimonadetes bacterium 13_1_40CM_3_66_12]OLD85719.1 MAG: hypothetical protein AUG85_12650 [Gemmatimonadetes bacterium 13_1_20CM_4_66_11]PYP98320.1 MAG: hypothetical protein DMD38_02720 [Gemmatimonadota bacterium]
MKYRALAVVVVIGVVACQGDRSYSAGPSALILDGAHGGGNAFFLWLPPVMPQQPPAGQVFSRQLSPTITISNLCSGDVIRTFAGSEVQPEDGQYQANWHTADDYLDAACTYRIAVQTGARQLGLADVDVVDDGSELQNVNTGEFIPLLDDRTLPIQFFIGIGSQCERADSDCGEGIAQPGATTTIVTENGQAGVVIPAGAVDQPVTIIIESADDRPCIAGLLEPVFSGQIGAIGNSCYDFHTEPPLPQVNAAGKFNTQVTVGICADLSGVDHATRDLLQIFQLHAGTQLFALNNVPAPFLRCDPAYPQLLGSRGSRLGNLVARLGSLFMPRPLFASTTALFDVGAGGSTDVFSRFTWALPSQLDLGFDQTPDLTAILPGAAVNAVYARLGVTFSRTNPLGLCPGTAVYANDYGVLGFNSGQNNISVCPLGVASDFNELDFGKIKATFAIPAVQACITATPSGFHTIFPQSGGVAFIEALDANGNVLGRTESTTDRVPQQLCVGGAGIGAVQFAGKGSAYAIFDNLRWTRVLPPTQ